MTTIDRRSFRFPRNLSICAASLGLLLTAPVASLAEENTATGFFTPSKNIYCLYLPDNPVMTLRCDIASGLIPQPPACGLDRTGVFLGKSGAAAPTCAGDTIYDRNYPILKYGRTWKRQGITCTSKIAGLTCQNSRKHGFFLSKRKWVVY
jgi:hypothetical protein